MSTADFPEKRPLNSNTFLVNSARTPPKPPTISKAADHTFKENVNTITQTSSSDPKRDETEEKLRKTEDELHKTKEKLKEKVLKENKLLGNFKEKSLIPLIFSMKKTSSTK